MVGNPNECWAGPEPIVINGVTFGAL